MKHSQNQNKTEYAQITLKKAEKGKQEEETNTGKVTK